MSNSGVHTTLRDGWVPSLPGAVHSGDVLRSVAIDAYIC